MLGFSVPPQLILGQSATLECNFDLEGSKLYSVKWYKNGQEFYRFMPAMKRQYDVFDVAGVNIDVSFTGFRIFQASCLALFRLDDLYDHCRTL